MRSAPVVGLLLLLLAGVAVGGGSAENAVLIVDPADANGLRVANHYIAARGIPAANVLFMRPDDPAGWPESAARNVPALLAELAARRIDEHVDYVVIASTGGYRIAAKTTVTDGCSTVSRFAISSLYAMAHLSEELAAGLPVTEPNRFFSPVPAAEGFSHGFAWEGGFPSADPYARRYFISALLGYTGANGNTVPEIISMIDRSAAADGTRPEGTFYFMQTGDAARSGPRHAIFPSTVAGILDLSGRAEHRMGVLPAGEDDVLGVMTGAASPDILGAGMTLLPGAFCDHLTSFAGTFDASGQTRMSVWIRAGASGSVGAVQEPCNYPGKFPRPDLHRFYFQGATLGEAWFRSAEYVPFQMLLYGDPLTRPFAHIPRVTVPDAPVEPVSGMIRLSPEARTTRPDAVIARLDLLIDGVRYASATPGRPLDVDTRSLSDGHHELRILAHDDTRLATTGVWRGGMVVANRGLSVSLSVGPPAGDLATLFSITAEGAGGEVREVRILHHGRVVAAARGSPASLSVNGRMLGAGPVPLVAEVEYVDGSLVRSRPASIQVADGEPEADGNPEGTPAAYGYRRRVPAGRAAVLALPATFDGDLKDAVFTVVTAPEQAEVLDGAAGPFRILVADPDAAGADTLTFRVQSAAGVSETATIDIEYVPAPAAAELDLSAGSIRDRERTRKDRVSIRGTLSLPSGFDPRTAPARVEVGDLRRSLFLDITTGDGRWKHKRGEWRYTSRKGRGRPKWKLRLDPKDGTFSVTVKKAELPALLENPIRVLLEVGGVRGSRDESWTENLGSPGSYTR